MNPEPYTIHPAGLACYVPRRPVPMRRGGVVRGWHERNPDVGIHELRQQAPKP